MTLVPAERRTSVLCDLMHSSTCFEASTAKDRYRAFCMGAKSANLQQLAQVR